MLRRTPSRGGRGRRIAVDFVACFGCGRFRGGWFVFFSSNAHGLLRVYEAALPHLPLYYSSSVTTVFMPREYRGACVVSQTLFSGTPETSEARMDNICISNTEGNVVGRISFAVGVGAEVHIGRNRSSRAPPARARRGTREQGREKYGQHYEYDAGELTYRTCFCTQEICTI